MSNFITILADLKLSNKLMQIIISFCSTPFHWFVSDNLHFFVITPYVVSFCWIWTQHEVWSKVNQVALGKYCALICRHSAIVWGWFVPINISKTETLTSSKENQRAQTRVILKFMRAEGVLGKAKSNGEGEEIFSCSRPCVTYLQRFLVLLRYYIKRRWPLNTILNSV